MHFRFFVGLRPFVFGFGGGSLDVRDFQGWEKNGVMVSETAWCVTSNPFDLLQCISARPDKVYVVECLGLGSFGVDFAVGDVESAEFSCCCTMPFFNSNAVGAACAPRDWDPTWFGVLFFEIHPCVVEGFSCICLGLVCEALHF